MKILGLSIGHDAAVALVIDGKVVNAISSERILREKKTNFLNWDVINYVLHPHGLTIDDIDSVVIGASMPWTNFVKPYFPEDKFQFWSYGNNNPRHNSLHPGEQYYEGRGYDVFVNTQFYQPMLPFKQEDFMPANVVFDAENFDGGAVVKPGWMINHHTAHAASIFFTSDIPQAVILSVDASGVNGYSSSAVLVGKDKQISWLYSPDSLIGTFYNAMTELLGYGPGLTKAGTLMGAAAYGTPNQRALEDWKKIADKVSNRETLSDDPTFNVWAGAFLTGEFPVRIREYIEDHIEHIEFRSRGDWAYDNYYLTHHNESTSQKVFDYAASVQYVFEQAILEMVDEVYEKTKGFNNDTLCLVGGSFLNCRANYEILKKSKFKHIHLYPACGDDGTSVGAALYAAVHMYNEPRVPLSPAECAYTGIEYPEINEGIPYDKKVIAKMLADSKIVAWFDGGSEFGPRALGHRSFLANPCDPKMKDILNRRVKHREWFRPFAPIVVKERVMDWFDMPVESPYMLYTAPVKQPWKVPSITHIDGTARVQTLDREMNEKVYDLILEFEEHTGVPIILNTSLNVNGQPIVETPQEALDLFYSSDIDAIVINNRMLIK